MHPDTSASTGDHDEPERPGRQAMFLLGQGVQDLQPSGSSSAESWARRSRRPTRRLVWAAGAGAVLVALALSVDSASRGPDGARSRPPDPVSAPGVGEIEPAPTPAAPADNGPAAPATPDGPCIQEQLALRVDGWDSAMGTSAARLVVTNRGSARCHLDGYPDVRLLRGDEDLWLTTDRAPSPRPARVRIAPGGSAVAPLEWKGYRQQADENSPQTLVVRTRGGVATDGEPYARSTLQVRLTGPRIDLVEGASLTVGAWRPITPTDSASRHAPSR